MSVSLLVPPRPTSPVVTWNPPWRDANALHDWARAFLSAVCDTVAVGAWHQLIEDTPEGPFRDVAVSLEGEARAAAVVAAVGALVALDSSLERIARTGGLLDDDRKDLS